MTTILTKVTNNQAEPISQNLLLALLSVNAEDLQARSKDIISRPVRNKEQMVEFKMA